MAKRQAKYLIEDSRGKLTLEKSFKISSRPLKAMAITVLCLLFSFPAHSSVIFDCKTTKTIQYAGCGYAMTCTDAVGNEKETNFFSINDGGNSYKVSATEDILLLIRRDGNETVFKNEINKNTVRYGKFIIEADDTSHPFLTKKFALWLTEKNFWHASGVGGFLRVETGKCK